jgi:HTH-type transcriptional regulator / antitoxin HipB
MPIAIRTPTDIGALIKDRRRGLKISQAELAQRIGVSRLWVNQVERGKPGASLGLVLRAMNAVGGILNTPIEPSTSTDLPEPVIGCDINAIVEAARRRDIRVARGDKAKGLAILDALDRKHG